MSPLVPIVLPLVMAVVAYALQRWRGLVALISAASTLAVVLLLPRSATVNTAELLGCTILSDPPSRLTLMLVFALATTFLLYSGQVPQGPTFAPLVLVAVGLLSVASMIQTFSLAVLLLEIAALSLVFLMRSRHSGAFGYLMAMVMAVPSLLMAGWLFDLFALSPEKLELIPITTAALGLGFALLLAAVPFHGWLASIGETSPITGSVFAALFSPVVIVLLINPLNRFPWLVTDATVFELLTIGGLVTAVAGGLLAAPQNEPGRVLAYAAISDLGVLLIGLGTASSLGLTGALLDLCNRSLAVVLAGMGWVLLRRYGFASQQGDWRGAGWQRPIAALSFLVGGLSLAGMPFLGGFASRWMIFSALGREGSTTAVLLVLAGGGVALGCLRVGYELFRQRPRVTMRERAEPTLVAAILIGLMLVLLLQGLFPELALGPIVEVVQGFAFVH